MNSTPSGSMRERALRIAEAVDTAWQKADHSGRRDVALSVVAGLSMVTRKAPNYPELREQVTAFDADTCYNALRRIYTVLLRARPELGTVVYPLVRWIVDQPHAALKHGAADVAHAAADAGLFDITTTEDRFAVDLLGKVLGALRSSSATKANAQIYTPDDIADLYAECLGAPHEAAKVADPTVGTGAMLRAVARAMRRRRLDPATVRWYGADIDELAVAACAINSIIWGLGTQVTLCVADMLTEPDWAARAEVEHNELIRVAASMAHTQSMIDAVDSLQALLASPNDEHSPPH